MRNTAHFDDFILSYEVGEQVNEHIVSRLLQWFIKHEAFCGESIMQNDNPQIYAAPFLSELADEVFKFDVIWKE